VVSIYREPGEPAFDTDELDFLGKVFFSHYEPRLRDNEQRAMVDAPRGGPVTRS
jgi:hypothetical protein